MQRKVNIRLLVMLSILATVSLLLYFLERTDNNLGVDKKFFQLDEMQEITDVFLSSHDQDVHFKFLQARWTLNDSLLLDQSMRDVFFSVLSRIEILRPIAETQKDSIVNYLKNNGTKVKITFGDKTIKDYWIGGNRELDLSWAMDNNDLQPYRVHLPGYQSYVAGIFSVSYNDWRSRFIFNVNFALINKIMIEYADTQDKLVLNYANGFFDVEGINGDSTKIGNFLDRLAYLQADQFIEPVQLNKELAAALETNELFATLTLYLPGAQTESITFYRMPKSGKQILAKTQAGSLCIFDYKRILELFKKTNDFD